MYSHVQILMKNPNIVKEKAREWEGKWKMSEIPYKFLVAVLIYLAVTA